VVLIHFVSVIYPALIVRLVSTEESPVNQFEHGALALPVIGANILVLGIGLLYFFNFLPEPIQKSFRFIRDFEVSRKVALLGVVALVAILIGISVGKLTTNEIRETLDFGAVSRAINDWPWHQPSDFTEKIYFQRHVTMFLLSSSIILFHNVKIIPFIGSISLVVLTYFITVKITKKRFAGLVAMTILIQSHTFRHFDTIASYENFWVLFYLLSLYLVYNKWYLSAFSYLLSIFSKPFSAPFVVMTLFSAYVSDASKKKKILFTISYSIALIVAAIIFIKIGGNVWGQLARLDPKEFWVGFTVWSYELRFDTVMLTTIIPLLIGLFITAKRGIKEANMVMFLILGGFFSEPLLTLFSNYTIQPYRYVPLVVFFSIGIATIFSKRLTMRPSYGP
jgi:hypothetical protein